MGSDPSVAVFIALLLAVGLALVAVVAGTIMLLFQSTRRVGMLMAGIGGVVLIVSAGLCFGILPMVSG